MRHTIAGIIRDELDAQEIELTFDLLAMADAIVARFEFDPARIILETTGGPISDTTWERLKVELADVAKHPRALLLDGVRIVGQMAEPPLVVEAASELPHMSQLDDIAGKL